MTVAEHLRERRVGALLSSAYFGFFGHAGFMQALANRGIRPAAIAGTSAGAITGAFAAADAIPQMVELLGTLRRKDFWDPGLPRKGRLPGLLKGHRFVELMARHLPVERFEDLAIPLVTVSTDLDRKARHVDTSGPLAPAVVASCALPPLFQPLMRDGVPHVDGGLLDKVPVRALLERHELDAVIVHMLPSAALLRPMPTKPLQFLNAALDLVRHDAWEQQRAWAEAIGVEVFVVDNRLPRLGPLRLKRGPAVIAEAQRATEAALDQLRRC